jgi:acyl carrier protein
MNVSSRTPEGLPHRCPVCGKYASVEPSFPAGDAVCPSCGHLLWWFRDRFGASAELGSSFTIDLGADSLELIELVMELEEEYDIRIPESEAEQIQTVEGAIRAILKHRRGEAA